MELNLIRTTVNRYRILIYGLNNRINEFEINKIIIFDLLKNVANAVNIFENEKNGMEKTIKNF